MSIAVEIAFVILTPCAECQFKAEQPRETYETAYRYHSSPPVLQSNNNSSIPFCFGSSE
jgi:hypothetical protein